MKLKKLIIKKEVKIKKEVNNMKIVLLLIILFNILGCSSTKTNDIRFINGPYNLYKGEKSEEYLNFNVDGTFVLSPPSYETFNDNLSYGTWKVEKDMVVIKSSNKITSDYFKIDVQESYSGSNDSIYVVIENPEVGFTDYKDNLAPYIYYKFNSKNYNEELYESSLFSKDISIFKNSNVIDFSITIIPNVRIYPAKISTNKVETIIYKPMEIRNNTFIIKIIDFDYRYFSYRRFENDYIKIIKKDTLLWDNELFIKTK